jgi:hypothetical protein
VQVAAGGNSTVGLKTDGTVVAVGRNSSGQLNVGTWSDIVQVDASGGHTVGVKSDGTVVAVGDNTHGQLNVGTWTDIVQVAAGGYHTVGCKTDGTSMAVGRNDENQCNVSDWDLMPGLDPTPDIKANGQDDPIFVIESESVNITIELDSGSMAGELFDWWVILVSSYGTFPLFSFQTPLFDLAPTSLLNSPLPPGWFIFVFNVEDSPDLSFQLGWYDYVVVLVYPEGEALLEELPDFDALVQEKMKEYTGK